MPFRFCDESRTGRLESIALRGPPERGAAIPNCAQRNDWEGGRCCLRCRQARERDGGGDNGCAVPLQPFAQRLSPLQSASRSVHFGRMGSEPDGLIVGYAVYIRVQRREIQQGVHCFPESGLLHVWRCGSGSAVLLCGGCLYRVTCRGFSQEVSGYGQSTPALPVSGDLSVSDAPSALATLNSTRSLICADRGGSGCYGASIVVSTERPIDALAAMGDGRVLIVEDGRRIRVVDGHTLSNDDALEASRSITFIGVAVDPRLDQRSRVYVAEAERRDDGTRELRIVRYRQVQNALGEPAVIVAGIHIPETGDAPFTVDSNGRIFIAIPSAEADAKSAGSVVFGFESDGRALQYQPCGVADRWLGAFDASCDCVGRSRESALADRRRRDQS